MKCLNKLAKDENMELTDEVLNMLLAHENQSLYDEKGIVTFKITGWSVGFLAADDTTTWEKSLEEDIKSSDFVQIPFKNVSGCRALATVLPSKCTAFHRSSNALPDESEFCQKLVKTLREMEAFYGQEWKVADVIEKDKVNEVSHNCSVLMVEHMLTKVEPDDDARTLWNKVLGTSEQVLVLRNELMNN